MPKSVIFGPVLSRRLGISLGIDLIPHKTCSLNCIYCECGKTTNLTLQRKTFIPTKQVIQELNQYLASNPKLDYLTFSGAGEPTLAQNIGKIIQFLKTNYPQYKTALLTNSTLLQNAKLRSELLPLDLIIPSLDTAIDTTFQKINAPISGLSANTIINGIFQFQKEFQNTLIIEIFIIPQINDTHQELQALKSALQKINPKLIQLNTLDRPGTKKNLTASNLKQLTHIIDFFKPLKTEIISKVNTKSLLTTPLQQDLYQKIYETIKRRPSTVPDLASTFNTSPQVIIKILDKISNQRTLHKINAPRGPFYQIS